ncbi:cupin domain-containing protein [Roseivivax marinus]|uniref:cupin domain-containing protein n=1 Tax=Roseivivax marinus TaxID=1379903 RepID=UPI00273EE121|nr:cupin domain-containing protein [Roseivivax marinus]
MTHDTYILTAPEIDAMDGLAKTHFLCPDARRVNRSLGDRTGLTGLGIHLIEVAPGDLTTELHLHHHEDEAVYILSGTAAAIIGETSHEVGPGDFIGYRKSGAAHTIRNTGGEPLRCLVIGERRAHDVVDYPQRRKRLYRNEGLPWGLVDHEAIGSPSAGRKA